MRPLRNPGVKDESPTRTPSLLISSPLYCVVCFHGRQKWIFSISDQQYMTSDQRVVLRKKRREGRRETGRKGKYRLEGREGGREGRRIRGKKKERKEKEKERREGQRKGGSQPYIGQVDN